MTRSIVGVIAVLGIAIAAGGGYWFGQQRTGAGAGKAPGSVGSSVGSTGSSGPVAADKGGGSPQAVMVEAITAAIDKHELPAMEPGAMCYMLSKQGYLSDRDGHWHPHLMFFASETNPAVWGADLPGSPVLALTDTWERLTTFLVPVRQWSDGTAD